MRFVLAIRAATAIVAACVGSTSAPAFSQSGLEGLDIPPAYGERMTMIQLQAIARMQMEQVTAPILPSPGTNGHVTVLPGELIDEGLEILTADDVASYFSSVVTEKKQQDERRLEVQQKLQQQQLQDQLAQLEQQKQDQLDEQQRQALLKELLQGQLEQLRQQQLEEKRKKQEELDKQTQAASSLLERILQEKLAMQEQNRQAQQQKKQEEMERLIAQLSEEQQRAFQKLAESKLDPNWLDPYPFYRARTAGGAPPWEEFRATFNGDVIGAASDGTLVTGSILLDVMVDEFIGGRIGFHDGGGTVYFHSNFDDSNSFEMVTDGDSDFFGGNVAAGQDGLQGSFHGPGWENAGGSWRFEANGGDKPGTASGEFAASR
jgi:hypothetical protein